MSDDADDGATLERTVLWQGSVGEFGLDRVRLPNSREVTLALLRHPGAAAVVPFLRQGADGGRIVLLRQHRHAAGETIWEVPAGKLDPGEEPAVCAARELEEETGYRAGRIEPTGVILTTPAFTDERIHLFCAWDLTPGTQALQSDEVIQVHEIALREALDMIAGGEIIDAKSIVALHHAARRVGLP